MKTVKLQTKRRVRRADNGIQWYVEEQLIVGKSKLWKIAKVRYSLDRARLAMEVLDGN